MDSVGSKKSSLKLNGRKVRKWVVIYELDDPKTVQVDIYSARTLIKKQVGRNKLSVSGVLVGRMNFSRPDSETAEKTDLDQLDNQI